MAHRLIMKSTPGASKTRKLVEILFLDVFRLFLISTFLLLLSFSFFLVCFLFLPHFLPYSSIWKKRWKHAKNAKKSNFDQPILCEALVCWLKSRTGGFVTERLNLPRRERQLKRWILSLKKRRINSSGPRGKQDK